MKEKRGRTYVALVLDRSGSMASVKQQTVNGYNEQVQVLLEEANKPDRGETFASLVTFNTRVTEDFFNAPVEILRELHPTQYNPSGGTALRDAVGYTIDKLCKETDPSDEYNSYLVIIISDGEELNSTIWSAAQLAERITELQNTNRWTFTYVGSNQDLSKVARDLGLKFRNTMSYANSKGGTSSAFTANAMQMKKFLDNRRTKSKNFSTEDFYEGAKTAEEVIAQNKVENTKTDDKA